MTCAHCHNEPASGHRLLPLLIAAALLLLGIVSTVTISDSGLGVVSSADAGGLDLRFQGFYDPNRAVTERTENKEYEALMREVSLVLGPKMAGPAASLGSLGIEVAYELSFAQTNANLDYWQKAATNPQASVQAGTMRVRKGLPYGLQVGSVLTHMFDSNMWTIGAELNMSLIDGFIAIPDLAVRLSANTVLGNADLGMLIVGTDVVLSKSFGIAGMVSLQPWAGYSMTYTHVNTHQIDVYPNDKDIKPDLMLLKSVGSIGHRGVFGMRVVITRVSIGGEFLRSFTDDLTVLTGKLGVDF
jgi:hypothetical protein